MRTTNEILEEAKRLIVRHEEQGRLLAEEHRRRSARTTSAIAKPNHLRPSHWGLHRGFDPYQTRSRAATIGHSIRAALVEGSFTPRAPIPDTVPKPSGGTRTVYKYQVADSAISRMIFKSVRKKNLPSMSGFSYAYRADVSAQHALQYLKSHLVGRERLYVAEYDFSKYFDTISHQHVRRVLAERFYLTTVEQTAVEAFLKVGPSPRSPYSPNSLRPRDRGVPQGTSISLFLANAAAWELDRDLEGLGVRFVRYADDTLIWASDYGRLAAAVETLQSHAPIMGVAINAQKSPGINLLVPRGVTGEIRCVHSVDYLGHRLTTGHVGIKSEAVDRMKTRMDRLIYGGLLREPQQKTQNPRRVAHGIDNDYISVVRRLRRYLYGDLDEKALHRFATQGAPLRRFAGAMSAYPLVDDASALQELDEWLLTKLWLVLRRRASLLSGAGVAHLPPPHGLSRGDLRTFIGTDSETGKPVDLTVPSTRRIARAMADASRQHGPAAVGRADLYV